MGKMGISWCLMASLLWLSLVGQGLAVPAEYLIPEAYDGSGTTDLETPKPIINYESGTTDFETPNAIIVDESGTTDLETPKPIINYEVENNEDIPNPMFLKREKGFEEINPSHINGEELFESDIRLNPEQRANLMHRKAIISSLNYRWTDLNGIVDVPYVFGDANVNQTAVMDGIAHWQSKTCIRFRTATDTTQPHMRFIKGTGCWSYIGRQWRSQGQDVSIGDGCNGLGTVVHEIGHALGFYHEQSRNDRDSYVVINLANIQTGRENNFDKAADSAVSNYSVPYDYISVMHYGAKYFTKNGKLTIATIHPPAQELIGSRTGLSHRDAMLANRMYPCIDIWKTSCGIPSDPCQNGGYLGESCSCVCPSHTSGTNCENLNGDYYDDYLSGCSQKITSAPTTVTSPNYPLNYPSGLKCVKWIVAPACHTVKFTITDFKTYGTTTCQDGNPCCYWDGLEIRTTNLFDGQWLCGDVSSGTVFTSPSNQMILYFQTGTYWNRGFNGTVEFVQDPSCTTTTTTSTTTTSTTTTSTTTTSTTPTTTTTTSTTPTTTTTTSTTPTTTTTTSTTSTTTSTTTTTPTTTTTTSTTTTTPTTTTTTSTTTTTASTDDCMLVESGRIYTWTSPNFGLGDYPNNTYCEISMSSARPYMALITMSSFDLESSRRCRYDYVSFTFPYDIERKLCGSKTGNQYEMPYFAFRSTFETDSSITDAGFRITMEKKTTSCHQLITLNSLGDRGVFRTWRGDKMCEIWIVAPSTLRVRLRWFYFRLSGGCRYNYMVVNLQGDKQYKRSTGSTRYCRRARPPTMYSVGNMALIVYEASRNHRGFRVKYDAVN